MGKVLQDIWILNDAGIVLYNRVYDERVDTQLFGALLSAINMFAEEISQGGLSNFELSDKAFTITKKEGLIFVANSNKKIKKKRINQELKIIIDQFIKEYGVFTGDFDGDITRFRGFEKIIEDSLDDPIKKFERGFW
ncbi:MAG: hypothetical protein EU544_01300 [Promethearchaeota archaeon]|nr:MAG: hypothetical protein EU544_01300 [Candidatus Lokiarchaeota archaeon]